MLIAPRARIASFGSAAGLIVAGIVCTALIGASTGQIVGLAAIGAGAVLATGLVFLEVGLSEDRERARERQALLKRAARPSGLRRRPSAQSRGHRRRLR